MGCSPWIPRNSSHRPQYDDTGASRHVESNTVEVLWVSAGFVATDFPSGPRPLPTHAQPACFPRPTKNSEEPVMRRTRRSTRVSLQMLQIRMRARPVLFAGEPFAKLRERGVKALLPRRVPH